MSLLYADTSALVRGYFPDEADHEQLRWLLLEGQEAVVTSTLARTEFASAVMAAARSGHLAEPEVPLSRFDADAASSGPISLLQLEPGTVLPLSHRIVLEHRVRTLDAIHLAVALSSAGTVAGDEPVAFVTRDTMQAEAAKALGLDVR